MLGTIHVTRPPSGPTFHMVPGFLVFFSSFTTRPRVISDASRSGNVRLGFTCVSLPMFVFFGSYSDPACVGMCVCPGGGHEPSPCDGTSVPGSFTGPFRSHSTCWHVSGIHLRLSSISHYGSNGHMSPCVVWWIPWFGPRIHPGLGILPFPSPGEDSPSCPGLSERG